jgi:small GTP-binding protein
VTDSIIKKKICLLGSYAVGKTSLVRKYVSSIFDESYHATLGVKVDSKAVKVGEQQLQLMIWDIAGAEDYFTVPMSYVRGSAGYLLVVDSTRAQTVERGMDIVRQISGELGPLPALVMLNKVDLVDQFQLTDDVLKPVHAMNCPVFRSSAKSGEGVEESFLELATRLI